MSLRWITLHDNDGTRLLARQIGETTRWHVIEVCEWIELIGEREAKDIICPHTKRMLPFVADLSEIDTSDVLQRSEAAQSWGLAVENDKVVDEYGEPFSDLGVVEIMHSYGAKAPLSESRSWLKEREAIRRLARLSLELESNAERYEAAMERPINTIGSTAREYARGELMAPVLRGVSEGNKSAEIMLKMYTAANGQTLGGVRWSREED